MKLFYFCVATLSLLWTISCPVYAQPTPKQTNPNSDTVIQWQQACANNEPTACTQLGLHYFPNQPKRAFGYWQHACHLNDAWGCYQMGEQYRHGIGAPTDPKLALQWIRKACLLKQNQASAIACNDAGYLYEQDNNSAAALPLYDSACQMGDQTACMNLVKYHSKRYQQDPSNDNAIPVQRYFDLACATQKQTQICAAATAIKQPGGMTLIMRQQFRN